MITLKHQEPIAGGSTQSVYQHPDDPSLLIKIRMIEKIQKTYNRKIGGMIGYKRMHGYHTTWMRELQHYFSVRLRLGHHPQFLQDYRGVADTDRGLGLVVGKVISRSGELAPTLTQMVTSNGLSEELKREVEELFRQLNSLRVGTTDISPANIVRGWNESCGDHLVIIDGIGVNTFIPLARFSNFFNIRSNNRHRVRTMLSLEKLDDRYRQSIQGS